MGCSLKTGLYGGNNKPPGRLSINLGKRRFGHQLLLEMGTEIVDELEVFRSCKPLSLKTGQIRGIGKRQKP